MATNEVTLDRSNQHNSGKISTDPQNWGVKPPQESDLMLDQMVTNHEFSVSIVFPLRGLLGCLIRRFRGSVEIYQYTQVDSCMRIQLRWT